MEKLSQESLRKTVLDCILSVAPEADVATLRPDKPWRDQLEIDSFDFQNILVTVDKRLGVDVPESDYRKLATLDDFVAYLGARIAS